MRREFQMTSDHDFPRPINLAHMKSVGEWREVGGWEIKEKEEQ